MTILNFDAIIWISVKKPRLSPFKKYYYAKSSFTFIIYSKKKSLSVLLRSFEIKCTTVHPTVGPQFGLELGRRLDAISLLIAIDI